MGFKKDFVWGAATSAYQIEGAAYEDGKGLSVWDGFCKEPGRVWQDHNGDIACDHYHRYQEDINLMKEIGLKGYRMSISWPRVIPEGVGEINPKGLDFYDRVIDNLLKVGITPYITLFHWDYPYELIYRGGWLNPDSANWFADYAKVVVERLSDRVKYWITHNEPQCFIGFGYYDGVNAPGFKYYFSDYLRMVHHVLLSHGKAVQAIRAHAKTPCQIGYAPMGLTSCPATNSPTDIEAARQATFNITKHFFNNIWWDDPIFFGRYPESGLKLYGDAVPNFPADDLKIISQPIDFLGLNIYQAQKVRADQNGNPVDVPGQTGYPMTAFRWVVEPSATYWGPRFFAERYHVPIYITENGMSNIDWVSLDGKVHDPQRIDFLNRFLLELEKACDDGVDIRGYFQWSLLDNFEWADGYKERFGLIYVDYPTQRRILKDSAYWYRDVIVTNGASLQNNGAAVNAAFRFERYASG